MNIWLLVFFAVVVVLTAILVFRLHAFLTLLLAGLLVAALTTGEQLRSYADTQIDSGKMSADVANKMVATSAPARLAGSFGETAGKIGILIALASIIGQCLLESGAASTIVERMLKLTGPRRAPEALAASAFVLGIPVFFDTVFYLMIPLARSLRRKLGKDYVLFILAILAGGSIAHSLVPPTPGPLLVAGELGVDIGTMMVAGLVIGGCSSVVSLAAARLINRLVDVPLRFDAETSDPDEREESAAAGPGDKNAPDDADRPSLLRSLAPIAVPVILITIGSVIDYAWDDDVAAAGSGEAMTMLQRFQDATVTFLLAVANKNVALAIGVVLAFSLVRYCPTAKRPTLVSRSLASAGNIILITAAGGAFGAMLRQAGIETAVGSLAQDVPGIMILPVAFAVTAAIRTLQGSATVAMITAVGVLQGFAPGLPFHPVYLAMAIGAEANRSRG